MEPHLQIRHLNVYYDRNQQALKDVNLDIPRKQITVIMGPSGCGKTTLLKSLNRFLELGDDTRISGQVLLDGEDIYAPDVDVTEVRKKTGLLAQRPYPLPMSIYDNVAYGMRIHQMKKGRDLDQAVQHYLEAAGSMGRGKGPAAPARCPALARPAAAPVPGARTGGGARDPAGG